MKTQFLLLAIAFLCCIGHLTSRNTNKERIKREKRLKRNIDFSTNGRMQLQSARKTRGGSTRPNTKNRILSKPNSNTLSFIINNNLDPQQRETYYYYPYQHQPTSSFTSRSYGSNALYDYYYQPRIPPQYLPPQYLPPPPQYHNPPISVIQPLYNSDTKSTELKLIGPLLATLIPIGLVLGLAWFGLIFANGLKSYVDILVSTQQQSTIDQKYLNLTNVINNSNNNSNFQTQTQSQNQSEVIVINGTYIIINRSGRTSYDESLLFPNPVELDYLL